TPPAPAVLLERRSSVATTPQLAVLKHPLRIGAPEVRRDPRGCVYGRAHHLQCVPVLGSLPVFIEPVDVDSGDPCVPRVVGQKIQEVDMGEYVIADGDDLMDLHTRTVMRPS